MTVEPRADASVVVDRAPAHGAGRAASRHHPDRVLSQHLHLLGSGLEAARGGFLAFGRQLDQSDVENPLAVVVIEGHGADPPGGFDRLLQGQLGGLHSAGGDGGQQLLQALRQHEQLLLLHRQGDHLGARPQLQEKAALARLADGAGRDPRHPSELEAAGWHRLILPQRQP